MAKSKYELVVFDWDGTLMDSEVRIVTCMQRAAQDTGSPIPSDAAVREIIGLSMERAVEQLFPGIDEKSLPAFIEAYRVHWLGDEVPHSALFPGAEETVRSLAEQGYLLAIATGKSRRGLDAVLQQTGLGELFHVSRCADEAFSKPHPQMLQDILTDLNTQADQAVMIGDTEYDMQMAANAGVDAVGVVHGVHHRDRLVEQGALTVFEQLPDLLSWVRS